MSQTIGDRFEILESKVAQLEVKPQAGVDPHVATIASLEDRVTQLEADMGGIRNSLTHAVKAGSAPAAITFDEGLPSSHT